MLAISTIGQYASTLINYLKAPKATKTLVGKLQCDITIYAHKNDKNEWDHMSKTGGQIVYDKFTEVPILYNLNQATAYFAINTPTRAVECVFENNLDVTNNVCIARQSRAYCGDDSYKATLNYPIEVLIELKAGQTVTVSGYFDNNETLHIVSISNYELLIE